MDPNIMKKSGFYYIMEALVVLSYFKCNPSDGFYIMGRLLVNGLS